MPFCLRRDSETKPSQKSSQMARCFLRSISAAVLRPFSSVTNWIPVILLFLPAKKCYPLNVPRHNAPVKAGGYSLLLKRNAHPIRINRPKFLGPPRLGLQRTIRMHLATPLLVFRIQRLNTLHSQTHHGLIADLP